MIFFLVLRFSFVLVLIRMLVVGRLRLFFIAFIHWLLVLLIHLSSLRSSLIMVLLIIGHLSVILLRCLRAGILVIVIFLVL
jgi:hypothetical protein